MDIFLLIVFIGLLILQIVMIVKFFEIAANVKTLTKHQVPGNDSIESLKHNIALEKHLGYSEKVREMIMRKWLQTREDLDHARSYGNNTFQIEETLTYLNAELKALGINTDELERVIFAQTARTDGEFQINDLVIEKATGNQWKIAGIFRNELYCTRNGGMTEARFTKDQVAPITD